MINEIIYEIGYKPASSIVIKAITDCIISLKIFQFTIPKSATEMIVPIHVIRENGIGNA
ncbi:MULTISPECIES: hypothetical protein [unclassified Clostridioides]|uniref:hypothetical protein n=1 Tax=unclassified Clostridioides TaxID=2635829 RepID=UPI001D0CD6BE|nr:hypothetical protein [Clostridioides sp. ES-S-0001-02]MCC0640738.1 hypothetical protein [Clostridioides sp. ES-S-0049-03]MCC0653279.1 hypothetical protein [Clostridioides sp. ES-S-0001-03]MCC0656713.1 hypothetical protein [Clostridioides sp. ES-S-0123-01]MCC0672104.1 hypothetical protein [Clostridioides sp. ES-S-0145-01]MCC0681423.1 hypothetical protein [Clostridioides sp. ES-S-0005-03]MCC0705795.1 hypothetical protein [Clostridioides sp. ES-S-0190-01]MCC0710829.1 hypothetical protein [Cl